MASSRPSQISLTRAAGRAVSIRTIIGRSHGRLLVQVAIVDEAMGHRMASLVLDRGAAEHMAKGLSRALEMLDADEADHASEDAPPDVTELQTTPRPPRAEAVRARPPGVPRGRTRPPRARESLPQHAPNTRK